MPDEPATDPISRADFRAWLSARTTLGQRAISDTVSRARRAMSLVNIPSAETENQLVFLLNENPDFRLCSGSVRSQIKRAAIRYQRFLMRDKGDRP